MNDWCSFIVNIQFRIFLLPSCNVHFEPVGALVATGVLLILGQLHLFLNGGRSGVIMVITVVVTFTLLQGPW